MSPIGSTVQPARHSYLAPPFEEAEVVDAMRMGVVSCSPETSLREAARMMATYRVHCLVVGEPWANAPIAVVSDLDLAAGAGSDADTRSVREVAATEPLTVAGNEKLSRAAQMMAEHGVAHLIVVAPKTGHPVGVLSTLDVAEALAFGGSA